jgi:hypothetical protein
MTSHAIPNESPAGPSGIAQQRVITPRRWYHTLPFTRSREISQEGAIFQRMSAGPDDERRYSIGHAGPFSIPETSSSVSGHAESPTTATTSPPVLVKTTKDKGNIFVTHDEYDRPVAHVHDPQLFASRASTLPCRLDSDGAHHPRLYHPVPSKPIPEDFYRSSPEYRAGIQEDQSTVTDPKISNRPRTPYPGQGNASRRKFATMPLPSSQRPATVDESFTPRGSEAVAIRKKDVHQELAHKTFPPRLPCDYRAATPFSFECPPTTTPFVGKCDVSQTVLLPSRYRNAPRIGGVDLELQSLEHATRTKPRRTAWPEQRIEVENDGGEERMPGVEVQEAATKKKGKLAWLKKWFKKKDAHSTSNREPAQENT